MNNPVTAMEPNKATVLVIDDSVTVRTVTKNFLERNHFIVITAKDGVEALELLKTNKIDIILLDIEMPRMDGFLFAETVREETEWAHIPIIMITFREEEEQKNRAYALGIEHFMCKPYQEQELLDTIEVLLNKKV